MSELGGESKLIGYQTKILLRQTWVTLTEFDYQTKILLPQT
jgi:hypothetical protein